MTFEANEEGVQSGAPVELYDFLVYGVHYYFTTASEDLTIGPVTYLAEPLSRSEIRETDDVARNDVTVSCSRDFAMLDFYDEAPPSEVILLTISRLHRDDADVEVQPWWSGRVLTGIREGERGELYCENVYTSLKRTGLHRLYQRRCPHILYGTECGANELLHRVAVTVDGYSGLQLQAAALALYADGRFAGGFIEWEATPGRVEIRGIKAHVGNTLTLTHPVPDLVALESVLVYKGCKHDTPDCTNEFANIENYGGFPFVPKQNPMGQTSVF